MSMRILERKNTLLSYVDSGEHGTGSNQNDADQSADSKSHLVDIGRPLNSEEVRIKTERKGSSGICRVCLQEGDIPIHGNDRYTDVSQELNTLAGINVRKDDGFPKHLCASCNSQLQGAIQLRTTAQYSEIYLQQSQRRTAPQNSDDESFQDVNDSDMQPLLYAATEITVRRINQKTGDTPSVIKNMFNLKVMKTDSGKQSEGLCLKIEPLDIGDKSDSKQEMRSHVSRDSPGINIVSAATPKIIKYLPRSQQPKLEKPVRKEPCISVSKPLHIKKESDRKPALVKNTCNLKPKIKLEYKVKKSHRNIQQNLLKPKFVKSENDFVPLTIKNPENLSVEKKAPIKNHCVRCKIKFESKEEYIQHTKTPEHKHYKVTCQKCKKQINWFTFKQHQANHDNVIRHVCHICGKGFYTNSALNQHRLKHSLILNYKCPHCPYRCRDNNSLQKHIRTHTGEKPYQCAECAEQFATSSNLYRHKLTNHKTQRDFICHVCSKGFHRKLDVEKHIRVAHMGIREHVCDICGKCYCDRKTVMKHKSRVHKTEKLKPGRKPLYMMPEYQRALESEGSVEQLEDASAIHEFQ